MSYSFTGSWNKSQATGGKDKIVAFNLTVPFSVFSGQRFNRDSALDRAWASVSANRNSNGQNNWRTGVGGTLLEERNLSYSVNQGAVISMVTAAVPARTGRRLMARWGSVTTTTGINTITTGNWRAASSDMRTA
jgi:outer membrane usher protein FimD/PapC